MQIEKALLQGTDQQTTDNHYHSLCSCCPFERMGCICKKGNNLSASLVKTIKLLVERWKNTESERLDSAHGMGRKNQQIDVLLLQHRNDRSVGAGGIGTTNQ